MKVALAQIAPVYLDRVATTAKVVAWIQRAAQAGAQLVCFGEGVLPGYPFFVERANGAAWESPVQEAMFAHYSSQAVQIERGDLAPVCDAARQHGITVVLGIIERPLDRGGHSLYCSLVTVGADGAVLNVHRKLMPTFEERLVWSSGDGHGLRTHGLGPFTLGALNCWENWMPLARSSLSAQGEDLHVALWPGNARNTEPITRAIAQEGRSYVLSVSGFLRASDIPADFPHRDKLNLSGPDELLANGGSCVATPRGSWLVAPQQGTETLVVADLDFAEVSRARHNFDPVGHYSRPDVFKLVVNRERQSIASVSKL